MSRILITGAGLIGQQCARLLSARGQACTLVDIRQPSPAVLAMPGVEFVEADILRAPLNGLLDGVDGVLHTAAMLSTGLRADPLRGLEVNILGTARLLEACRAAGVRRFVQASSATVVYAGFPVLGPGPIPEDASLGLVSHRPGSLYALTKQSCEHLALLWRDLYGLSTVSLRFAAVVGGDADTPTSVPGRLMSRLIAAARAGGAHLLDDPFLWWDGTEEFIDPRDCGHAMIAALDAVDPAQGVYAIANPKGWTLDAVAAEIASRFGAFTLTVPDHPPSGFAGFAHVRPAPTDLSAAARELGFSARHELGDTLQTWWSAA
ncbi:MAG: NAD(P)-dependent oxidoreductase [Rhodobacter sp.]|nr:NAD(P)-dependent oxidoreductase [Paracoccaceae bacterium]MCC0078037.1 NAD(P)-dependent oxidoreductase [Rhodobacter sp.]